MLKGKIQGILANINNCSPIMSIQKICPTKLDEAYFQVNTVDTGPSIGSLMLDQTKALSSTVLCSYCDQPGVCCKLPRKTGSSTTASVSSSPRRDMEMPLITEEMCTCNAAVFPSKEGWAVFLILLD